MVDLDTILIQLQQALLGEVTSNLRAVTLTFDETSIHFDAYFDSPPSEDDCECMSEVETALWAHYYDLYEISHNDITLAAPDPIQGQYWIYHRFEGYPSEE